MCVSSDGEKEKGRKREGERKRKCERKRSSERKKKRREREKKTRREREREGERVRERVRERGVEWRLVTSFGSKGIFRVLLSWKVCGFFPSSSRD